MTNLDDRFTTLDGLRSPNLWHEIEVRSTRNHRFAETQLGAAVLVAGALALALLGGLVIISSGGPHPRPAQSPVPSVVPTGAWTPTGSMLHQRAGHTATLLRDGRVLVAGGLNNGVGVATAELYDPRAGTWVATGRMVEGRGLHEATLLADGTVLVTGGVSSADAHGSDAELASAEVFDPSLGTWTATAAMPEAKVGHVAILLGDGHVLVAGGWGSTERFGPKLAAAELYDPAKRSWTATGSLAARRDGQSATLLPDGNVLVAGGYDAERHRSTEMYDPATGAWTFGSDLPEAFNGHVAVLLADGRVLLAGGDAPRGPGAVGHPHAALYNPATGDWLLTESMAVGRLGQTAALLRDGSVLITGGQALPDPRLAHLSSSELYDPATESWVTAAAMTEGRSRHTATLLADGSVLVTGGEGDDGIMLASAEVYRVR